MNLKEFITQTLLDLDGAVEEVRTRMKRDVSFSKTVEKRTLEFDIAVSAEDSSSKDGGASIKVLSIVDLGGGIETSTKNTHVSRIQFGIDIATNTKNEVAERSHHFDQLNRQPKSYR